MAVQQPTTPMNRSMAGFQKGQLEDNMKYHHGSPWLPHEFPSNIKNRRIGREPSAAMRARETHYFKERIWDSPKGAMVAGLNGESRTPISISDSV